MKIIKLIAFIIFTLSLLLFYTCSRNTDKETLIKFWAMGSEAEYVTKLVPEFEKRNPGIKVKVQAVPWNAAQEKLITAFASDNTPDACQLGNTWVPQFTYLDAISNLDEYINESSVVKKENYFEGIWDTNVLDSLVYGVPWYVDTRLIFYRTDIFERAGYKQPPKSWDELYDLCKKIKALFTGPASAKHNAKTSEEKYAIYLPTNEWPPFIIFGLQNNASLLKDNNTRAYFSSREFKESFEFLIKFHKEKLAPIGISQVTNVYQALKDEYFSIYISGPWNINEFKKWMTGNLTDKWSTAPMPSKSGEYYPGVSLAGGSSLVVFKNSQHKKETWKFIEFLSEPSTQIKFYNLLYNLPAVKEAWEDSSIANNIYTKAFYEQFNNVVATPKIPEWEQIAFSKVQQYAELAARGAMSIDEALQKLDKDVNQILEKRRWLMSVEDE